MSIGIGPQWSDSQRVVWLSSSQNTSILAEIPCITVSRFAHGSGCASFHRLTHARELHVQDVRAHHHMLGFSWDASWLRWYFDETIIYEEPIRTAASAAESSDAGDGTLVVNFSYASRQPNAEDTTTSSAASSFQIEKMQLQQGDSEDPGCLPRHRTNADCRKKARKCHHTILTAVLSTYS